MNIRIYKMVLLYLFNDLLNLVLSEDSCKEREVGTVRWGESDMWGECKHFFHDKKAKL